MIGSCGVGLTFSAVLFLASRGAGAADDDVTNLLRIGVALRREHRNEEALATFARARALSPKPAVLAQLGLAEQACGRWLESEQDLDAALAAEDDRWIAKNRAPLEAARATVRDHLAWLTVDVDVPSADLRLDGRPFSASTEVRVLAGTAVVDARASGYEASSRRIPLAPGVHVHEALALVPLAAPVSVLAPATKAAASPRSTAEEIQVQPPPSGRVQIPVLPAALILSGIVGIGIGTGFGIQTIEYKRAVDAECMGGCTSGALADYWAAQSAARVSTIAFGVGFAAASAGGLWWLLGTERSHPPIVVAPALGQGGNGLVVGGHW
jgi:hypothetical protein